MQKAKINRAITRMDELREASERAGAFPQNHQAESTFMEYLGDTTPTEVKQMLTLLSNANGFANRIFTTMETFAQAKRIAVSLELKAEVGKSFTANRIVIEIAEP